MCRAVRVRSARPPQAGAGEEQAEEAKSERENERETEKEKERELKRGQESNFREGSSTKSKKVRSDQVSE